MLPSLYCLGCGTDAPHQSLGGSEAACTSCGTVREAEADQVAVEDMAFCDTCRETRPAGHVCYPDAPPCESRTHLLSRCGMCPTDLALQAKDLARRAEYEHGSPSDLYTP
ncbi:hypothetical protein ACIBK9_47430 [Nonomuraea sp. NPDC050227]|uniref:hypothetical protein n=1 Tax=Nonomuraea sp. NPDC050227 TaxID=3364360 RepID=UPI0037B0EE2E